MAQQIPTTEHIATLAQDKTPEGRAAFLRAVEEFNAHSKAYAEQVKVELAQTASLADTLLAETAALEDIEGNLEIALRNVRAANANLRRLRQPWWIRWFVCF